MRQDLDDGGGDHHHIQAQVKDHKNDGDAYRLLETTEENGGQECQEDQGDRNILALQPGRHHRVLDEVGRGIRRGKSHGDHEVRGGKAEQHQHQQFASPAWKQTLEHGDGALAAGTFPCHAPVDRKRAEQGNGNQDDGGQR